jgi:hypothetical protein
VRGASAFTEVRDEGGQLAKAIGREQRCGRGRAFSYRPVRLDGPALGDGGMATIGQPDDQVWIGASTDVDDLDPLPAQWVVWVAHRHESRRRLVMRSSVLLASRRSKIGSCRRR